MTLQAWLLFFVTAFAVSFTPGPVMMLAMTNGIRVGVRRTLFGVLGTSLGNFLLMLLSSLGLGALLYSSALLFDVVKWLGAAYLIFLGIQLWIAPAVAVAFDGAGAGRRYKPKSNRGLLLQSLFVSVSNPKGLLFFGALFPQFIERAHSQVMQFAVLSTTFLLIDGLWQVVYAMSGRRMVAWLKTPRRLRALNRASGTAFIGAGVFLSAMKK